MGQVIYLTPQEVVTRWNNALTVGTLANKRSKGEGPPFVKFGTRVRYPLSQLVNWEEKNAHLMPVNDNQPSDTELIAS